MIRLNYTTQSYDWGKLGDTSKVADLARVSGSTPGSVIQNDKPYAELWMGTHPNGPSTLHADPSISLKSILNEQNVGASVWKKYQGDLPYLFKVLSIRKALSIQAHPDKTLAKRLFEEFPKVYKDPNHKPEMALALTPFEALLGFRPLEEIAGHLSKYPEFGAVVGESVSTSFISTVKNTTTDETTKKAALKTLFKALMECEESKLKTHLRALVDRVKKESSSPSTSLKQGSVEELMVRFDFQFPDDVGVFCALVLNYVQMDSGDAIFLAANEPHAYISGDCIECMAASDNVVRTGLTPKFKDVKTLTEMLTYRSATPSEQLMRGDTLFRGLNHSALYDPPIEEFSVLRTELHKGQEETLPPLNGPSLLIVTSGKGTFTDSTCKDENQTLGYGQVYFIPTNMQGIKLKNDSSSSPPLVCYTAFCEVSVV